MRVRVICGSDLWRCSAYFHRAETKLAANSTGLVSHMRSHTKKVYVKVGICNVLCSFHFTVCRPYAFCRFVKRFYELFVLKCCCCVGIYVMQFDICKRLLSLSQLLRLKTGNIYVFTINPFMVPINFKNYSRSYYSQFPYNFTTLLATASSITIKFVFTFASCSTLILLPLFI